MNLEQLREKDPAGAFSDFIEVADAKVELKIPEDFWDQFPDKCECGSSMIITNNLKRIMCCNPRCKIKVGLSLEYVFSNFQCKGIGERTCRTIANYAYDTLKYKSHLELLNLGDSRIAPSINGSYFVTYHQSVNKVKNTPLTFAQMISKIGIPEFEGTALSVFEGINNSEELIRQIQIRGDVTNFLAYKGVYDPAKVFYLREFLLDIAYAEKKLFNRLRLEGKVKITISATGNLNIDGVRITKAEFVELCNDIGTLDNGMRVFEVELNAAIQTNAYVIADYPSSSSKYVAAKNREALERKELGESHKLLYTSKEFVEHLKELIECVKKS